ncbi:hypothetical protein LEP1GSC188_0308 [Leptospira weilii serovar Topaz str. LT2116]|uniref:Uncharacterized protein n=1 Tax=Leptospira weilii serovar Topaz str. LT2116 TaxID=1088540 RepID=M3G4P2_9LEPT|nr:hypothetical protein LEP1GSC188_0308 [Leptospira weilii serovar Topaz str. LT2116]
MQKRVCFFRILSLYNHSKVRGCSSILQTSGNSPKIGSGDFKKHSFQHCDSSFEKLSPMIEDVRRELFQIRSIYRLMKLSCKC